MYIQIQSSEAMAVQLCACNYILSQTESSYIL